MKLFIAFAYTAFTIFTFVAGYLSEPGPLNYVFVILASFPWTAIFMPMFRESLGNSPIIPIAGILINFSLLWWWALRKRNME